MRPIWILVFLIIGYAITGFPGCVASDTLPPVEVEPIRNPVEDVIIPGPELGLLLLGSEVPSWEHPAPSSELFQYGPNGQITSELPEEIRIPIPNFSGLLNWLENLPGIGSLIAGFFAYKRKSPLWKFVFGEDAKL